jgi:hypothetical protein
MVAPLRTASISIPGFYGMNTTDSGVTLDSGYARIAENCVIEEGGRLGARLGWEYVAQTATPATPVNLKGMHRFVDIDGAEYFGAWSDTAFYIKSGGDLDSVTYTNTPGTNTLTDGNWQAATLNDAAFLFQRGYEPIYFNPTTGVLDDITTQGKGTPPQANTVLSAYGRLWVADTPTNKTTVYWSNLLDGAEWRSGTGTVGSLDISGILVYGNDEIVGLGAHNGRLIIFCKNNIIIMDDQDAGKQYLDPADMALVEVINGVGCIARDSIVNTGTDILFLSESGVRSLGRTIQEKSQPMRDISRNVRDLLVTQVSRADKNEIKACYSESNGFYLLAIPEDGVVWCFDTRIALQNGSAKVTRWNSLTHTDWIAFDGTIYMSSTYGIAEYKSRRDNGESYQLQYFTPFFNFGMQNIVKVAKQVAITAYSSYKQKVGIKVNTDYKQDSLRPIIIELNDTLAHEYNIAEWGLTTTAIAGSQAADTVTDHNGIHYTVDFSTTQDDTYDTELKAWLDTDTYYYTTDDGTRTRVSLYVPEADFDAEYGGGDAVENVKVSVGGSGFVIQLGFESTIDGGFVSIQQVDLFVKQGRLR